ncbi:uncharacterized protein LOC129587944 [Paramacrobiotus metropolitanus]|uniref:uncharacterized protein LOC129587944 n=1 Tax=Paramacrobiotus metropolitanus TaxID=2943436 RepID=UPI002445F960|nr:uncharacterized protein LOC129587944 [Paramacrobiotus metropolitanus]
MKLPDHIQHSHDFRDAAEFAGKNVLVIGRSYSAEDIAVQCHKYGAASVVISYLRGPFGFDWPPGITERPLLRELQGKTAYFRDGSTAEVDAIILATGFQHHFPFLPDHLRLQTANLFYPPNFHKGIFWNNNPRLIYLGMQDQRFTFPLFDAQAWYARDVILGRITIPGKEERERDAVPWREREAAWTPAEKDEGIMIHFQGEYMHGSPGRH